MGTITQKLQKLARIKADIRSAIIEKGQSVVEDEPFSSYAGKIAAIQAGGGAAAQSAEVTFRIGEADYEARFVVDNALISWKRSAMSAAAYTMPVGTTIILSHNIGLNFLYYSDGIKLLQSAFNTVKPGVDYTPTNLDKVSIAVVTQAGEQWISIIK